MLGRFPALAGVDLDVESGEIVLLAGANGAGKTTLLRLCAGLLPLRSGSAEVLGVDLAVDRRAMRRSLALVGHETFCYDDMTVRENIRFATRAVGRSVADGDAALDRLSLGRVADVGHGRLSQGQRRRVALAIALARDPRLLLLDEPHAGLDEQSREVLNEVVLAAPGLFWAAVLLAALLAIGRSFAVEESNGARDGLRLSGLDGGAIFVGKAAAIAVELFLLEVVLGVAVVALYGVTVSGALVLLCASVAATIGLAATGTVYGVLATGLRARDTLVPLLVLPAVTPVMLGGSRAFAAALEGSSSDAWPWVQLLAAFSILALAAGTMAFGPLLEES
jgi:heme exporter protein CcmB